MSENLAIIPETWSEDMASAASSYATIDYVVLSPNGNPTIRLGPDTSGSHGGLSTREVDNNNDWVIGRGQAGDHVIWRCWVKTGSGTQNNAFAGGRIGIDFYGVSPQYPGRVLNLDTLPHDYTWSAQGWVSPALNGFPELPITDMIVPWGNDWTLLEYDFVVPATFYSYSRTGDVINTAIQIGSTSIWIDAREVADSAYVWFGDAEWYINPSDPFVEQVQKPTFNPVGGVYGATQNVTISSLTSGATLYYTDDGSTPTAASTEYTAPVAVASTKTLKALGVKAAYTNSSIASSVYTINNPVTPSAAAVKAYLAMLRRR